MRVVLRSQGIAPGLLDLITKLQSAHDDEARDIQKYRMLAFEALNAIKGPLGMAVNGELSAISAQENSHREMLSTIIMPSRSIEGRVENHSKAAAAKHRRAAGRGYRCYRRGSCSYCSRKSWTDTCSSSDNSKGRSSCRKEG